VELESPLEVLPYHVLGVPKHRAIGEEPPLQDLKPPDPGQVARVQEALRGFGARISG
jgi:pyruvate-formate lyase-activating enzyme